MKKLKQKNKSLTCQVCGKTNKTVEVIYCGYMQDVYGKKVKEVICKKCEHEHLMDI